jgi:hypothetical protein
VQDAIGLKEFAQHSRVVGHEGVNCRPHDALVFVDYHGRPPNGMRYKPMRSGCIARLRAPSRDESRLPKCNPAVRVSA